MGTMFCLTSNEMQTATVLKTLWCFAFVPCFSIDNTAMISHFDNVMGRFRTLLMVPRHY